MSNQPSQALDSDVVNATFQVMSSQRNQALDQAATLQGNLVVTTKRLQAAEAELAKLRQEAANKAGDSAAA